MNESIILYKKLLDLSSSIKTEFLKNVPMFENQLQFTDLNELAYTKMYEEIKRSKFIKTTPELYKEIPGLKELYNRARKYYLAPRNKSVKGLDVQLGMKFEESMIAFLNSEKLSVMRADMKNKKLPDIMVLDRTRNIKAYIELKYHNAPFMLSWRLLDREPYEGSITMDSEKLEKQLIEIESELERPVYFVHWVDFPDLKGVFFNTHEQIAEYLKREPVEFDRNERKGDFIDKGYKITAKVGYTKKFYPPLHEMGDFKELIEHLQK